MQAFCCEVVRARTKLGMAMAANRPMMATTIMISTRVKPDLLEDLIFILALCFILARRELSNRRVSYECKVRSRIACCIRASGRSTPGAKVGLGQVRAIKKPEALASGFGIGPTAK